jgi:hypothetical protein
MPFHTVLTLKVLTNGFFCLICAPISTHTVSVFIETCKNAQLQSRLVRDGFKLGLYVQTDMSSHTNLK